MTCPEDQFCGQRPMFSANDLETSLTRPHLANCFATRRDRLAFRDVYHSAGSGSCGVHCVGNLLHHGTHQAPPVFAENHDRQFAALQILLVRQICVGREKHLKPSFLGCFQQVTIAQRVPPLCSRFLNDMALQRAGNASGRSVVKENVH